MVCNWNKTLDFSEIASISIIISFHGEYVQRSLLGQTVILMKNTVFWDSSAQIPGT
jgi:hypothetical protein